MTDRELIESWGFETAEEELPVGISGLLVKQLFFTAKDKLGHLPLCTSRAAITHKTFAISPLAEEAEREMAWRSIKATILKELCK